MVAIFFLALSTVVWSEQLPRVDPTTRIQKHVVSRAVIYEGTGSERFNVPLDELFGGDNLTEIWNILRTECQNIQLEGKDVNDNSTASTSQQEVIFKNNSSPINLSKFLNYSDVIDGIFISEDIQMFLKKIWKMDIANDEYFDDLLPSVNLFLIKCYDDSKTFDLEVIYPRILHFGHQLEVWDAGDIFEDNHYYSYHQMPFNVFKTDEKYYTINTHLSNVCMSMDTILWCSQEAITLIDNCDFDTLEGCNRVVHRIFSDYTTVRTLPYFYLIVSPFKEFVRRTSTNATVGQLTPYNLTYIKLGPDEKVLFEHGYRLNGSDGSPFYMVGMTFTRSLDDKYIADAAVIKTEYVKGSGSKNLWFWINHIVILGYFALIIFLLALFCVTHPTSYKPCGARFFSFRRPAVVAPLSDVDTLSNYENGFYD